jgi:hypothetical protein
MNKKDDEKLKLLADYVHHNTTLPVDVVEFLLECSARAKSWGGYLPYKQDKEFVVTPTNETEKPVKPKEEMASLGIDNRFLEKIFNNMDKDIR